jgi:hypothetical protein
MGVAESNVHPSQHGTIPTRAVWDELGVECTF